MLKTIFKALRIASVLAIALLATRSAAASETMRASESRDLLPAFAVVSSPPPPPAAVEGHRACSSTPGSNCRIVQNGTDRRPALILPPGAEVTIPIEARAGDELRFEIARPKWRSQHLTLTASLDHANGSSRRTISTKSATNPWRSLRLPVLHSGAQKFTLHVSQPPDADPRSAVAIASPRHLSRTGSVARERPNILLYLMDTLRADHTSAQGYERRTTPRLDAIASEGTLFEQASSTAPVTRPSTASILTSLFPSQTHARLNQGLSDEPETLAEILRQQGWSTWAFVANGNVFAPSFGFDQGFDRFETIRGKNLDNHAHTGEINDLIFPLLQAQADEPFFLYVHAVDPHSPYDPPASHRNLFTNKDYSGPVEPAKSVRKVLRKRKMDQESIDFVIGLYDEDIHYQDEAFGLLLDELARHDQLENTLVVVVADHGDEFLEHGDWEHGNRLYEHQTHVPFVVSGPDVVKSRVTEPVSLIDVMPTILGLVGAPIPEAANGQNLAPVLRGEAKPPQRAIYNEEVSRGREWNALSENGWKIIRRAPWTDGDSDEGKASYEPFHLREDAGETLDLAADEVERLEQMRTRLIAMRNELRRTGNAT
ncbi:MAG: sulfatase, partial [bacterium]